MRYYLDKDIVNQIELYALHGERLQDTLRRVLEIMPKQKTPETLKDWRRMKVGDTIHLRFETDAAYFNEFKTAFNLHRIRHTKKELVDHTVICKITGAWIIEVVRLK